MRPKLICRDAGFARFLKTQSVEKQPTLEQSYIQAGVAVRMLVYINTMSVFLAELTHSLREQNQYKAMKKHHLRKFQTQTNIVYKDICELFSKDNRGLRDDYDDVSYQMYYDVDKSIALEGAEKWYNAICALSVLIEELNNQLMGKFKLQSACYMYNAPHKLKILSMEFNPVYVDIIRTININYQITK